MIKKALILITVFLIAIGAAVFIYRYQIIQYSAEKLIKNALPGYAKIGAVKFYFKENALVIEDFRILNPSGFSEEYLLEIRKVACKYKMKGKDITSGIEIYEPVLERLILNIERLASGRINLAQMAASADKAAKPSKAPEGQDGQPAESAGTSQVMGKQISDLIKLPEKFLIKNGKIIFKDEFTPSGRHVITFENIEAEISLRLDSGYRKVLSLGSSGTGNVNGYSDETLRWTIAMDPTAPRLTMSNRFEAQRISIRPFEPYYDKYSPFIINNGRFSGTMIFDFDNGSIGSTNEIRLSDLNFSVKRGYENAQFWETTVPDLVKYFTSPRGEIVFDFKIKGQMSDPKFYLGPISKAALTSMAVDKISEAIQKMSQPKSAEGAGAAKNDMEKAQEYIDLFKGLINKK